MSSSEKAITKKEQPEAGAFTAGKTAARTAAAKSATAEVAVTRAQTAKADPGPKAASRGAKGRKAAAASAGTGSAAAKPAVKPARAKAGAQAKAGAAKKEPAGTGPGKAGTGKPRVGRPKKAAAAAAAGPEAAVTMAAAEPAGLPLTAQKILFVVSEVAPFVTTGGMGQVVGALPAALKRDAPDMDIRVVAPYYQKVREKYGACMKALGSMQVQLAWRSIKCAVFQAQKDGVIYYFLDSPDYGYFNRDDCYGYFDDGERFAFFAKSAIETMELTGFVPDVVHAHDWQAALSVVYLKTVFARRFPQIKTVFTIHNLEYQGQFDPWILGDVFDLPTEDYSVVEYQGCINLMKGAIVACDRLTTVSPSYAWEIREQGKGYGLESILNGQQGKLVGIINGIDTKLYDPAGDPHLVRNYTAADLEQKAVNKRELQTLFGLPGAPRKPLLCMVSRLVEHKGLDLLCAIAEELLRDDLQLLILGTGDHKYEWFFTELAHRYRDKVAVNIAYNAEISNKIYAGADIMLMPSRSEPCGLSQMIACRYGTVPVARATGGIRDTIKDCRFGEGNGFLFKEYDAGDFLDTIRQAIHLYTFHEDDWRNLMREGMASDFGWELSARAYADVYGALR